MPGVWGGGMSCSYCEGEGWTYQMVLIGFGVDYEAEPCRCNPKRLPPLEFKVKK